MGSLGDPVSTGNAVDSTVDACPCRRTGFHFAGTCFSLTKETLMLPVTGYVDRWSVRPGEEINFMIGVRGGGRYRDRIARVICGDPNPQGPGYREIPVSWALEGEHDGEEQRVVKGSWIDIPLLDLGTGERRIGFAATIWPTLIAADRQAVLSWKGGDAALTLGIGANGVFCRLATPEGLVDVDIDVPLTQGAWREIACLFDPAARTP